MSPTVSCSYSHCTFRWSGLWDCALKQDLFFSPVFWFADEVERNGEDFFQSNGHAYFSLHNGGIIWDRFTCFVLLCFCCFFSSWCFLCCYFKYGFHYLQLFKWRFLLCVSNWKLFSGALVLSRTQKKNKNVKNLQAGHKISKCEMRVWLVQGKFSNRLPPPPRKKKLYSPTPKPPGWFFFSGPPFPTPCGTTVKTATPRARSNHGWTPLMRMIM